MEQLEGAIGAVFGSWMNDRAIVYRRKYRIPRRMGHRRQRAGMVFGNMGDDCATGVAFTRDPATGENVFYGEYLINAQGEDVVAGIRTPEASRRNWPTKSIAAAYKELEESPQDAGEAFRRRAGLRVHDRGRQAVHAADPQRQAHRLRRRADRASTWSRKS